MRFKLEKSKKEGYWVCTDTVNLIVCTFRENNFNEDQKFTTINEFPADKYMDLARYAREMSDWLRKNHYDKIF